MADISTLLDFHVARMYRDDPPPPPVAVICGYEDGDSDPAVDKSTFRNPHPTLKELVECFIKPGHATLS